MCCKSSFIVEFFAYSDGLYLIQAFSTGGARPSLRQTPPTTQFSIKKKSWIATINDESRDAAELKLVCVSRINSSHRRLKGSPLSSHAFFKQVFDFQSFFAH